MNFSELRWCNRSELSRIWTERLASAEDLFAHSLASACTNSSIGVFVELVTNQELPIAKATAALQQLIHCPIVSAEMLAAVWALCNTTQGHSFFHQACVLSWASMGRLMISSNSLSTAEQGELVARLSSLPDKLLSLKGLGNLGSVEAVKILEQAILNETEAPLLRVQAIDALRHTCSRAPARVSSILMAVFADKQQTANIRLSAFRVLLAGEAVPNEKLCQVMRNETNSHIRAYVQSAIRALLESHQRHYHAACVLLLAVY